MSSYSFPLLSVPEICEFFNEVADLDIWEDDFKAPTKERWVIFFNKIIGLTMRVEADVLNQVHLQPTTEPFEFPAMFTDAIPAVNVTMVMTRLATACGIEHFHVGDILQPTTSRLIQICSAIQNFYRFQIEHIQKFDAMRLEKEAKVEQQRALKCEVDDMKLKLEARRTAKAAQLPEIKEIQLETEKKKLALTELHKCVTENRVKLKEKKERNAAVKKQMADQKVALLSAHEKCASLDAAIVQSPDRLCSEQQQLTEQLARRRTQLKERTASTLRMQGWVGRETDKLGQSQHAAGLLDSVAGQREKLRELVTQTGAVATEAGLTRERNAELRCEEERKRRALVAREEKLVKTVQRHESNTADDERDLQQAERELSVIDAQHSTAQTEVEELRTALRRLQDDDAAAAQTHASHMADMQHKYRRLLQHVDDYNDQMATEMCGHKQMFL